jgi:bacterioferritin
MKGDAKIIKHLNTLLKRELTAINQFFLHARLLEDWGAEKMAAHEMKESVEEMEHADELIKRIILLGGLPNLQELDKLHIGENIKEVIEGDMIIEKKGIESYRAAIKDCEELGDFVTRDLLSKFLMDEENHLDELETQLHMIETMGLENFIQLQSGPAEKD